MAVATDTLERIVHAALAEDIGAGDVTTEATVGADAVGTAGLLVKEAGVVCGLRAAGSIPAAVELARAASDLPIEVECDTLEQVGEALDAGIDAILLDNMALDELRAAVELTAGRARLEASGGVTLDTIRAIAETGVDEISVGALTHSARSLDVSLELT